MEVAGTITDIAEAGEPTFVTERFAVADGRLEIAGHWRGVRGRRFVRPVLWLHADGGRRRLVAVLDHKPWAAVDGAPWTAAFAWDGSKVEAERAELEVGRELLVDLPVPGGARPPRRPSEAAKLRRELAAAHEEGAALRAQLDGARTEIERARADGERLVNLEYQQRERALLAADEASRRAREAEERTALVERQLNAARASYAELEERLARSERARAAADERFAAAEAKADGLDAAASERGRLEARLASAEAEMDRLRAVAAGRAEIEERLEAVEAERDRLRAAASADSSGLEERLAAATADGSRLAERLAAAEQDRDRLRAAAARADGDRLRSAEPDPARLETAEADRERLRHALGATEAERARLERDVASARADRERVEAELAALRTPAAARTSPAIEGTTRLGTPRSGTALWVVRLVALALVVALFAAVAVLVAGVL